MKKSVSTQNTIVSVEIMGAVSQLQNVLSADSTFQNVPVQNFLSFAQNLKSATCTTLEDAAYFYDKSMKIELIEAADNFVSKFSPSDLSASDSVIYTTLLATDSAIAETFLNSKKPATRYVSTTEKIQLVKRHNAQIIENMVLCSDIVSDLITLGFDTFNENDRQALSERIETFRSASKIILSRLNKA